MSTRITLSLSETPFIDVEEPFQRVQDLITPLEQPSSALAARQVATLHKADGTGRIMVHPQLIAVVEEDPPDAD